MTSTISEKVKRWKKSGEEESLRKSNEPEPANNPSQPANTKKPQLFHSMYI